MPFNLANEVNRRRGIRAENDLAYREGQIDGLCRLIENYKKIESELKDVIVNDIGSRIGNKDEPRTISLQLFRIRALSNIVSSLHIRAEKRTVLELRETVLDVIAWAEYIQLTEDYIPKLLQEAKTFLNETSEKQELQDSDFKHFLELIFEEFAYVQSLQQNPKQWVAARKDTLKKTITYANRTSIEPKADSFESLKSRFFPENVLQFKQPKSDTVTNGIYGICDSIIAPLDKYCRH